MSNLQKRLIEDPWKPKTTQFPERSNSNTDILVCSEDPWLPSLLETKIRPARINAAINSPEDVQGGALEQVRLPTSSNNLVDGRSTEFPFILDPWTSLPIQNIAALSTLVSNIFVNKARLFQPNIAENPYQISWNQQEPILIAQEKAGNLVDQLEIATSTQRKKFGSEFGEVFEIFKSPQTFKTLLEFAQNEIDAEILLSACQLKIEWQYNERWNLKRCKRNRRYVVTSNRSGSSFSWVRAVRITEAFDGNPCEEILDVWLEDWLSLKKDIPGFLCFGAYADKRASILSNGMGFHFDERQRYANAFDLMDANINQISLQSLTGNLVPRPEGDYIEKDRG